MRGAILVHCGWISEAGESGGDRDGADVEEDQWHFFGGRDSRDAFGGTDQNVHPPTSPDIQSESFVYGDTSGTNLISRLQ